MMNLSFSKRKLNLNGSQNLWDFGFAKNCRNSTTFALGFKLRHIPRTVANGLTFSHTKDLCKISMRSPQLSATAAAADINAECEQLMERRKQHINLQQQQQKHSQYFTRRHHIGKHADVLTSRGRQGRQLVLQQVYHLRQSGQRTFVITCIKCKTAAHDAPYHIISQSTDHTGTDDHTHKQNKHKRYKLVTLNEDKCMKPRQDI